MTFINDRFESYRQCIDFCNEDDDEEKEDIYPGFENIYWDFKVFYNRLKIKPIEYYEEEDEYDENYLEDLISFLNNLSFSD